MAMSRNAKTLRDQNGRARYEALLRALQIELVKVQKHVIKHGHKVLVIVFPYDEAHVRAGLLAT